MNSSLLYKNTGFDFHSCIVNLDLHILLVINEEFQNKNK